MLVGDWVANTSDSGHSGQGGRGAGGGGESPGGRLGGGTAAPASQTYGPAPLVAVTSVALERSRQVAPATPCRAPPLPSFITANHKKPQAAAHRCLPAPPPPPPPSGSPGPAGPVPARSAPCSWWPGHSRPWPRRPQPAAGHKQDKARTSVIIHWKENKQKRECMQKCRWEGCRARENGSSRRCGRIHSRLVD